MLTNKDNGSRYFIIYKNGQPISGVLSEAEVFAFKTKLPVEEQSQLQTVPVTTDGRMILNG